MSTRKIDFGGPEWSAFPNDHWFDFAGNPNLPDYWRITFIAYGKSAANGHARLDREELSYLLVRKNGTRPDRRNVKKSIDKAVALGYLSEGSRALCLIVSRNVKQIGKGDSDRRCDRDHSVKTNDVNESSRSQPNDVSGLRRSKTNDADGLRRSPLSPSLSSPNHQDSVPARALHAVPDATRKAI